jgi:uncharacterized heparinase superfamily protein
MKKLHNLYHTVKHLKFTQVINRFKRKLIKPKLVPCPDIVIRPLQGAWLPVELIKSSYVEKGVYCFLNHQGKVSNWNDSSEEKLWLYNLHYFDDLNAIGGLKRKANHRDLIAKWVDENPPLIGNGWEPYPQSLRIVNWVQWFLAGNLPESAWQKSLWLQVAVLEQDLEYHLLGNHLFANAKALVFAGSYFVGDDASRWLNKGLSIIDKELAEQILDDGGNFELTPMYHNTILADVLDLINLATAYQHSELQSRSDSWRKLVTRMLSWMNTMTHPNGEVSFFNDSAIGIAPTAAKLNDYAENFGFTSEQPSTQVVTFLKNTGYIKLAVDQQTAFLDVAKVGPDYIPGHAHADTLSFEWNYGKQRVFVNSGTSVYGLGDERLRQRKTEAHNTVVVDEQDSSEVWSGFRVARRAYPTKPIIEHSLDAVTVKGSHNGYCRLPGKVTHTRKWSMNFDEFSISDSLTGMFTTAIAHYHLHPDIHIEQSNAGFSLTLPDKTKFIITFSGGQLSLSNSTWHPEFGLSIPNKKLTLTFSSAEATFKINRVI